MKKILFVFAFLIILCSSLVFADTSATLTIRGYKNSTKQDNLPTEGLIISVYDTRVTQSFTSLVTDRITITDDLGYDYYKTDYNDIFSIKIQTNLKANVSVDIQFSPFINQGDTNDYIPTSYKLTASGTDYINPNYYETSGKNSNKKYYFIKYVPSFTNASSEVSGITTATTVNITQTITVETGSAEAIATGSGWNSTTTYSAPSVDAVTSWSSYTSSSSSETLDYIGDAYVESMIYVQMKLDLDSNYEIATNVDYKAPVKITVSAQ